MNEVLESPNKIDFTETSKDLNKKEFSFDEGVTAAIDRIKSLLSSEERDLFIVINGSGSNVGKTALLSELGKALMHLGVYVKYADSQEKETYDFYKQHSGSDERAVYIITESGLFAKSPDDYREKLKKGNRYVVGDLYIAIYRPDKKFLPPKPDEVPVADILINNERAINDPLKV